MDMTIFRRSPALPLGNGKNSELFRSSDQRLVTQGCRTSVTVIQPSRKREVMHLKVIL
jgi:hypothetical protein